MKLFYYTPGSTFSIWMRTGSYIGYQTSATGWTQIVNNAASSVTTISGQYIATIRLPELLLSQGTTYGFCILSTGTNPLWTFSYNASGNTATNADLSIYTLHYFYGSAPFSGYWASGYTLNLEANYRNASCPSSRVPIEITVKPSPNGAGLVKGTPFQTTQPNSLGVVTNPDIVAESDQITYELTPPTGYNNADFGTTWTAKTPVIRTKKGTNIPSGTYWSYTPPSGSSLGKISFSPDKALTDSFLIISVQIEDLGPYFCDSTILRHIFVAPRPVPNFTFTSPICDGDAVLFNDDSRISSGGISYIYNFNTGNPADTSVTATSVFTFPTFGTYMVKLTTTSTPYGYSESITIPVVVTEIPKIGFKVLNACEKVAVTFTNSTTIGTGAVVYEWDFGDPTTNADRSTKKDATWTYASAGAYRVSLKTTASGCVSQLSKNANQFATPVAKFTAPALICDKSEVQFANGSTIKLGNMGYTWSFGDGGVSNFANPTHQYSNAVPRQVQMKAVSEFGCVDSIIKTITLSESPLANFTWTSACNLSNTNFMFTGTKPSGALTNFTWNFAGEGSSTVENPSKLFKIVGRNMVTLTLVSNNGCSDVITKDVNVKLQSKADFEVADLCEDEDAVFINSSKVSQGNLLYNWKFGDGAVSNSQSPRHLYYIGGVSKTFNVTLVAVVPGGCSDSINKQVSVNAKPNSDFTFKTSGSLVYLDAKILGSTSYHWRFGDGAAAFTPSTQYDYRNYPSGIYNTCLTVINAAGCYSETCKQIVITGGIEQLAKLTGVSIYPNPSNGHFTIAVQEPKSDIDIEIYNILGELMSTVETNALKSTYAIDLDETNSVYIVKITNGGYTEYRKITLTK